MPVIRFITILTIIFSCATSWAAVNASHPRIWLDSTILTRLQGYASSETAEYTALKTWCDDTIGDDDGAGYQFTDWYKAVLNYGLMYQVSGTESYAEEGVMYLTALLRDLNTIGDGNGGTTAIEVDSGWTSRTLQAVSIGRDWFDGSTALTASIINECSTRMDEWIEWMETDPGSWGGYTGGFDPLDNHFAGFFALVYTAAIGLYGDTYYDSAWMTKAESYWTNNVLVAIENGLLDGGDWHEGWNYGPWASREYLLYPHALETGTTNDDHWDETDWAEDLIKSHIHMLHPDRDYFSDDGSWSGSYKGDPNAATILFCTNSSDVSTTMAGLAVWYVNHLDWEPRPPHEWESFLWTNSSISEVSPTVSNMGSLAHEMYGHGISRGADWTDQDATWMEIVGKGTDNTQGEKNMGELKIASRGEVLLTDGDEWEYDSEHANVPTITYSDSHSPYQEWYHTSITFDMENDDDYYTYFKVDNIDNAYDGNNDDTPAASHYSREVFFVRPDIIVVYDNLIATSTSNVAEFRWYWNGSPTVSSLTASLAVSSAKLFMEVFGQTGSISSPTAGSRTGTYYIEFDPTGTPTDNQTVTLFEVGPSTQSNQTTSTYITATDTKMKGVHVAGDDDVVCMFTASTDGSSPSGSIVYQYTSSDTVKNYLSGLSGSYSILASGSSSKTVTIDPSGEDFTATDSGILAFSVGIDNNVVLLSSDSASHSVRGVNIQ